LSFNIDEKIQTVIGQKLTE